MDSNEDRTVKLIRHLDGELMDDEKLAVEALLNSDETARKEFANLSLAKEAVVVYGLKSRVAAVRQQMLEEEAGDAAKPKMYPFVRSAMKYAAVISFVFISALIYLYATTSSSKLYNDNYQSYKISVARDQSVVEPVVTAFNSANYPAVIAAFQKISNPNNRDYFLAAQAYQLTHQYPQAIKLYNRIMNISSADNLYHDQAEYYLGLTYLKNDQPREAKAVLDRIYSDPDQLYHSQITFWTMIRLKLLIIKTPEK